MVAVSHLDALDDAADRISSIIRTGELATTVDHLPRWRVRDVVAHLGGIHAWASRIVEQRSMDGPGFTKSKLDGPELCDWFDAGARQLIDQLRNTNPTEPCPNFNPGSEKTVAWWNRRQAHETTIHRWDVEKALGCTTPIDQELAADGIGEFLDVFVRTRGKQTLESTVIISTGKTARQWTLTPANKPGRIDVASGREHSDGPVTEVVGEPEALLLALWGRCSTDEANLSISGDPSAVAALID